MADAQLEAARPRLLAMASADVLEPDLPVAVMLQESNDLLTLLRDETVWSRLRAVGVQLAQRDALAEALGVTRAAQSAWTVLRDRTKSDAQRDRETRGYVVRDELLAVGRWNLRHDRTALGTLSAIAEGEGVADLTQDLSDLAELIERRAAAFAGDQTFALTARVEEARALSSELAAGTSQERLDTQQAEAVDLRNRAYTELDSLVTTLREAGRYAFRDKEDIRKRFSSQHLVQKGRRSRAERKTAATPGA